MASNLMEKLRAQENTEKDNKTESKSSYFNTINHRSPDKDKQISAKVNSEVYEKFSQICVKEGLSRNSAINMLINRYVREHSDLINT